MTVSRHVEEAARQIALVREGPDPLQSHAMGRGWNRSPPTARL